MNFTAQKNGTKYILLRQVLLYNAKSVSLQAVKRFLGKIRIILKTYCAGSAEKMS